MLCIIPFLYHIAATLIHSKQDVIMGNSHCALLCISPHYGKTSYTWEKFLDETWETIEVSVNCCLLFVSMPGKYRCSSYTDDTTDKIVFEVKSMLNM